MLETSLFLGSALCEGGVYIPYLTSHCNYTVRYSFPMTGLTGRTFLHAGIEPSYLSRLPAFFSFSFFLSVRVRVFQQQGVIHFISKSV